MRITDKRPAAPRLNLTPFIIIGLVLLLLTVIAVKVNEWINEVEPGKEATAAPVEVFQGSQIEIDLKTEAYKKLVAKRKEALKVGLLFSSKDDLVNANLRIDGKAYACQLRLKGDLMDHLQGDRWSFRIILKGGDEWKGMKTFSIHNSKSRSHTAEWLMHEVFKAEGIIVPAYDFIQVKLNGLDLGAYAYEHHFEDQLLKLNGREPGPILKHNDDAYWENVHAKLKPFPWVAASHIELFNKTKINDPAFAKSFNLAHGMLNDFLNERKSVEEVFDIELMARYYALLDISHAWHAQQFTNIRFYLNPLSGKLEPIAFDCFGDYLPEVNKDWEAFGESINDRVAKEKEYDRGNVYRYLLFRDRAFHEHYMSYLSRFTHQDYLNEIKNKYGGLLESRAALIRSDDKYKEFKPNWEQLFTKANFTQNKIQPRPNLSLKAVRINNSKNDIELKSFHYFPLELVGYGSAEEMLDTLPEPLFLEAYNFLLPVKRYQHRHDKEIDYVYYRTLGVEEVYKTALLKSNAPQERVELIDSDDSKLASIAFVQKLGRRLFISGGRHVLESVLIIPKDHILEIAAGTELVFKGEGKLLSYGEIKAVGSKQQPIKFYSEEQTACGLLLSGNQSTSEFAYCHFLGLSGFSEKNISTEAAVGVFESSANFSNCQFLNIDAKHAFSCWYATIEMTKCVFQECTGIGIVSKYSNVKLTDLQMRGIGKNGITMISGSLNGTNVNIKSVLNRGMELLDNTYAYVWSMGVSDAYQGLFASGHSRVKVMNLWLDDLKRGIEVRGTTDPVTRVEIGKLHQNTVERLYLLKEGVSLTVDGKTERG